MSHMGFSDACGSSSTNVDALFDEKDEHDLGDFTVTKINDTEKVNRNSDEVKMRSNYMPTAIQ